MTCAEFRAPTASVHLRLDEVAQHIEGDLISNNAQRATLVARDDAPGLEQLGEAFQAMGAVLLAAECATEAACGWRRATQGRGCAAAGRRAR